jgi:hypothetical protein
MIPLWRRLISLDRRRRGLIVEAVALIAIVWTGVRVDRLGTARRILDIYTSRPRRIVSGETPAMMIREVSWAVRAVAARLPSATCLVQALAADAMLRRRRLRSELRIGVRDRGTASEPFDGHAWVECNGIVAVGRMDDLSEFRILTAPGSR